MSDITLFGDGVRGNDLAVKERPALFAFDDTRGSGPAPCVVLPAPARQQALKALQRRVLAPARAIDIELTLVAVTPTPRGEATPCIFSDSAGRFWIAADPVHDPSQRDGKLPIPRVQLQRLVALRNAGLSVDLIVIAHELPQGWGPQMPVPSLVPAAPETTRTDHMVVNAARGVAHGIAATLRIAATVGAAVAFAPIAGLDPVVLGGVSGSKGATAWSVLATWTWDAGR